jgi:hypothetical protein
VDKRGALSQVRVRALPPGADCGEQMSKQLKLEVNPQFEHAKDKIETSSGATILFTPPVGEGYWIFRVKLRHGQAILAFPKFGQIGCGFAKEDDWNTNLPISCKAEEIYDHIKHNKKYKDISREDCLEAIRSIQKVALAVQP